MFLSNPTTIFLCLLALILTGCDAGSDRTVVKREGMADVVLVADSDKDVAEAIQQARATFGEFVNAFQTKTDDRSRFSIKYLFTDGEIVEHMWVVDLVYDEKKFSGTLNNFPNDLRNIQQGAKVDVDPARDSDWYCVEKGKLIGGYTIIALYKNSSLEERQSVENALEAKIDWPTS